MVIDETTSSHIDILPEANNYIIQDNGELALVVTENSVKDYSGLPLPVNDELNTEQPNVPKIKEPLLPTQETPLKLTMENMENCQNHSNEIIKINQEHMKNKIIENNKKNMQWLSANKLKQGLDKNIQSDVNDQYVDCNVENNFNKAFTLPVKYLPKKKNGIN